MAWVDPSRKAVGPHAWHCGQLLGGTVGVERSGDSISPKDVAAAAHAAVLQVGMGGSRWPPAAVCRPVRPRSSRTLQRLSQRACCGSRRRSLGVVPKGDGAELRLMCVLAHPDDESLGTGGALAQCAAEEVATYLVTATRGERGRFGDSKESPGPEIVGSNHRSSLHSAQTVLMAIPITSPSAS